MMHELRPPALPALPGEPAREPAPTAARAAASIASDRDALGRVYVRHRRDVYRHVRRILANHDDAEDVTQQVFLKLTIGLDTYESAGQLLAWMLRVAHNAAIDHLRRNRLVLVDERLEQLLGASEDDPDCGVSLREAIESLPPAQRDVLLLRDVAGLTPSEVASRLGTTRGAVNTCHHRARVAARRTLADRGCTPVTGICEARA